MGVRDRFFTPTTARAMLSWRILIGVGVALAMVAAGLPIGVAIGVGVGVYAGAVLAARPRSTTGPRIDPFTVGEPWRRMMQQAQRSGRELRHTVGAAPDGPVKTKMLAVADQLDVGLSEAWKIARRGDEIDDAVRRLDRTGLRSRLAMLQADAAARPSEELELAIASVERQLATADRLALQSAEAAASLQRAQTRLDELVARASELRLGAVDTAGYERDVDELVIELEALHRAIEEIRTT